MKCTCSMDDGIHEWTCAIEVERRAHGDIAMEPWDDADTCPQCGVRDALAMDLDGWYKCLHCSHRRAYIANPCTPAQIADDAECGQ